MSVNLRSTYSRALRLTSNIFRVAIFLGMVLAPALPGWADDKGGLSLSPEEFRAQFTLTFEAGDSRLMRELASAHRDLLRPSIDELLEQFLQLDPDKEAREAQKALSLARRIAELAREISNDQFPLRQVERHASWSAPERALKAEAEALSRATRTAFHQGRFEEAVAHGKAAVALYAKLRDEAGQGRVLHFMGQAERKLARYAEAIIWHQRALALAKRSRDRVGRGSALVDFGDVEEQRRNYSRAIELYRKGLSQFRLPEDWREAGRALRQLGDVHVAVGDFESAYEVYAQALRYAEEGHDPIYMAEYHDYVGYFYRRLGDYAKAIATHRRALVSAGRIAQDDVRARARARALNHLGYSEGKLAELAALRGDHERAVRLYREGLRHEEEALQAARQVEDRWRQGYILRTLSFMHRELGNILAGEEALHEYRRSMTWAKQALHVARGTKQKEWEGLAFHHMGLTQARLGQEAEGLASFERALDIWKATGDLDSMAHAYRFIAHEFHEARGRLDEALANYARSLELFKRLRATEFIAAIQLSRGTIYERKGDLVRARHAYLASIETLEAMRRKLTSEEHKLVFFERRLDPYEALISLLLKLYRRESRLEDGALALHLSERARARAALDLLQEVSGKIRAGVDETTLKRERDLRAQYYAVARELLGQRSTERIALLRGRLEILELKYNDFLRELESRYPAYARLKHPQPLTLAEIQKQVLGRREVLLEYFVGERETYLFVVGKERLETILTLPIGKRELAEKVEALRLPFEQVKLTQSFGTLRGFDLALAHDLYSILLKPAEPYVRTASAILLVPHGPLFYLPFELLVTDLDFRPEPEGVVLGRFETARYVIEVYPPISYAPSASVLDPRLRRDRSDSRPQETLLAFGNPTGVEPSQVRKADAEGGSQRGHGSTRAVEPLQVKGSIRMRGGESVVLPPLPYAEQEVKEVAELYGRRAKIYLRGDATKGRFLSEGPGYPMVLLSTHGIFDERHPMYSALVFAPKAKGGEFELLETHEIFNMRLRAELVTLSACEVGLGKIREGEGLVGLSRAFLYAGASSLVVSLWSVYDRSTAQLITGLYRRMREAPGARALALRESKLQVLKTRQKLKRGRKEFSYAHPFFWAPFILVRGP